MTQIEAKALELFPDDSETEEIDTNWLLRAAFIKGCQYAATPSAVSREDAEKWAGIQAGNLGWVEVGCTERADIIKVALAMYDHLQGKSPTPADPGSQVEAVGLLKWMAEIDLVYLEDRKGWFGKTNWKHDGVNHEQLITLYKQSL